MSRMIARAKRWRWRCSGRARSFWSPSATAGSLRSRCRSATGRTKRGSNREANSQRSRSMTVKEFAERAEISQSLAYLLIAEGRVPHRRIGQRGKRGKILIREDDLLKFLDGVK